jgi:hypothetical protein
MTLSKNASKVSNSGSGCVLRSPSPPLAWNKAVRPRLLAFFFGSACRLEQDAKAWLVASPSSTHEGRLATAPDSVHCHPPTPDSVHCHPQVVQFMLFVAKMGSHPQGHRQRVSVRVPSSRILPGCVLGGLNVEPVIVDVRPVQRSRRGRPWQEFGP